MCSGVGLRFLWRDSEFLEGLYRPNSCLFVKLMVSDGSIVALKSPMNISRICLFWNLLLMFLEWRVISFIKSGGREDSMVLVLMELCWP